MSQEKEFYKKASEDIEKISAETKSLKSSMEDSKSEVYELRREQFRGQYPKFKDFLQNEVFSFIVAKGIEVIPIKKNSAQYEQLVARRPFRKESNGGGMYYGSDGEGARIYAESEGRVHESKVKSDYLVIEDDYNNPRSERSEPGESIGNKVEELGLDTGFAVLVHHDSDYHRDSFTVDHVNGWTLNQDKYQLELKKSARLFLVN